MAEIEYLVAPALWASLLALLNQRLPQPVDSLNPLCYGSLASKNVCHDITSGAYSAGPGWDACTGWGHFVERLNLSATSWHPLFVRHLSTWHYAFYGGGY
jgi:hypothetical protein